MSDVRKDDNRTKRHRRGHAADDALARRYTIVVVPTAAGFESHSLEIPEVRGHGKTAASSYWGCIRATTNATRRMSESGQFPPLPIRAGRRDEQMRIPVTASERLTLEAIAARDGFRSVSDYVRSAALRRTG